MNACTGVKDFGVMSDARGQRVSVTDTYWGYVIRSEMCLGHRAAQVERVCAVAGVALLAVSIGQWFLPELHAAIGARPLLFGSTVGLGVAGLMFLWLAWRGLSRELHVDLTMSSLRQVVRNRRGRMRIERVVPFNAIESAFVRRIGGAKRDARLCMRLKDGEVIHVAKGGQAKLEALNERMSHDLKPVRVQVDGWHRVGRKLMPMQEGAAPEPQLATT